MLVPFYRAAGDGSDRAHQMLVHTAIGLLRKAKAPPPDLCAYLLDAIQDPEEYARRMKEQSPAPRRGRPSVDDRAFRIDLGLKMDRLFGSLPTEKNALMIAYLLSKGHPINQETSGNKESAVLIVSGVVRRSTRSLQGDYYRHQNRLSGSPEQLELGRMLLCAYGALSARQSERNAPSQ